MNNLIRFRTNLDNYQIIKWNYNLPFVPRIKEEIKIPKDYIEWFKKRNLPTSLEITSITYYEDYVEIYLWFTENDFKIYNSDEMIKSYGHIFYR